MLMTLWTNCQLTAVKVTVAFSFSHLLVATCLQNVVPRCEYSKVDVVTSCGFVSTLCWQHLDNESIRRDRTPGI